MKKPKLFQSSVLLATSGLTLGTSHGAVVTTFHGATLNFNSTTSTPLPFDINQDSSPDFNLVYANSNARKPQITTVGFETPAALTNQILYPMVDISGDPGMQDAKVLSVLQTGTVVDGSLFGGPAGTPSDRDEAFFYANFDLNYYGAWGGGSSGATAPNPIQGPIDGYVGLAIPDGAGGFNYGYAHLIVDVRDSSASTPASSITLMDSAYETTPNQAITITAIPEPSLSALVAGAAGLLGLRRRRPCS